MNNDENEMTNYTKTPEAARRERVSAVLTAIAAAEVEPNFQAMVANFLKFVGNEEGFSPDQMKVIAWRAAVYKIRHDPKDFPVSIRKTTHMDQVRHLNGKQYEGVRAYLTPQQQAYTDAWRAGWAYPG